MAASITYSNPLAQWPNTWTQLFGSSEAPTIGGNNLIASFANPVMGGAANVATMQAVYGNSTVARMIERWSGGNSWQGYLDFVTGRSGIDPSARVSDVLASSQGPAFLSAMAQWEAGQPGALSLAQWQDAISMGMGAVQGDGSGRTLATGSPNVTLTGQLPTPFPGTRPGDAYRPSAPGGLIAWVGELVTRTSVIVLGLVVLGVGLAMFGRVQPVAAYDTVRRWGSYRAQRKTAAALGRGNAPGKRQGGRTGPRRSKEQVTVDRLEKHVGGPVPAATKARAVAILKGARKRKGKPKPTGPRRGPSD